jgi:hypothetical protein
MRQLPYALLHAGTLLGIKNESITTIQFTLRLFTAWLLGAAAAGMER